MNGRGWFPAINTSMGNLLGYWRYLRGHRGFNHAPVSTLGRLASWRLRCSLGIPATVRLRESKTKMFLPPLWRGNSKIIFTFRENYELELTRLHRLLSPGQTFADVGACYGIYTLVGSQLVGESGQVLAFEPARQSFEVLERNIALNSLRNVRAYHLALFDQKGTARLFHHADTTRNSLGETGRGNKDFEEVPTATLDSVVQYLDGRLKGIDVIKMDVEGAEEKVLRGARTVLAASHPTLIFEVNPEAASRIESTGRGAWGLLREMGYSFWQFEESGNLRRLESPPSFGNVVALHPTRP